MTLSKIALAVVTLAALSPAVSNASPEKVSVKACASAFASSIAAPGTAAPGFKLDYHGAIASGLTDFYPSEFTYELEARNPKTGAAIARARCEADSRGTVTNLSAIPLDAKVAAR